MSDLHIGIIGTGGMAKARARALAAHPGATLVAVASRRQETADAFVAEHGGRAHHRWEEVVDAGDVDAVCICTPNDSHLPLGRAALEQGKAVLVEYPLARTGGEAQALAAAARRSRQVLHTGHTMCFSGKQQTLQSLLADLGPLRLADMAVLFGRKPRKWYPDPELLGAVFVGAMIHFHGALYQLFGDADWVEGHLQEQRLADGQLDWDLASMDIGFKAGGRGRIVYGRGLAPPGWPFQERYACADGYVEVAEGTVSVRRGDETLHHSIPEIDAVQADTDAFLAQVLEGEAPQLPIEGAVRGVEIGEAAARSAQTGRRIHP